ncbi:hypothetical protein LTR37_006549 [Vermiconidia calcicola]|uniref:Uncharacterized protein n=1 Tax=Vermiconidia calcicola TaxID=1690605 RepID=A0ACC3NHD1_9PEZI|nr:hypothetical protein LTR37_006549 [Vermiconidia calcicola]
MKAYREEEHNSAFETAEKLLLDPDLPLLIRARCHMALSNNDNTHSVQPPSIPSRSSLLRAVGKSILLQLELSSSKEPSTRQKEHKNRPQRLLPSKKRRSMNYRLDANVSLEQNSGSQEHESTWVLENQTVNGQDSYGFLDDVRRKVLEEAHSRWSGSLDSFEQAGSEAERGSGAEFYDGHLVKEELLEESIIVDRNGEACPCKEHDQLEHGADGERHQEPRCRGTDDGEQAVVDAFVVNDLKRG